MGGLLGAAALQQAHLTSTEDGVKKSQ
jgi:hypothetical protein